jgi:hypothetical protein
MFASLSHKYIFTRVNSFTFILVDSAASTAHVKFGDYKLPRIYFYFQNCKTGQMNFCLSCAQRVPVVELVRLHGIMEDEFMIFMFKVARALRIPFTCSRNERHRIMPPAETHPYSHPSTCTRTRASPWAGRSSTGYSRIQRTGTPPASTCPRNAGCTRRKGGI